MLDKKDLSPDTAEFVIQGKTKSGELFRPANWGERLCDMLSTTATDGRVMYSSYAQPFVIQGVPSVVVRLSLEQADPKAFEMIRQFVITNHLLVRVGRNRPDAGATGLHPTNSMERRTPKESGWQ